MRLYHRLVYAPRLAAIGGHTGMTVYSWTFCAERAVSDHFRRHEYRHVVQWYGCTALAMALVVGLHVAVGVSWWWLVASPLGFLGPYWLTCLVDGYEGSLFERDARRYADRTGA